MSHCDPVDELEVRLGIVSESQRLEGNVVDIVDEGPWDCLVGLTHFGQADLKALHQAVADWEVFNRDMEDALVVLSVRLEGESP